MMRKHFNLFILIVVAILFSCNKDTEEKEGTEPGTSLIKVPLTRQATNYTCGVAALQSILYYYGEEWRQDRLEAALNADSINGTNYRNILTFCKGLNYTTNTYVNLSIDSLKMFIDEGYPMMLAIQAWSDYPENYSTDWDDGHWVVCIGYDNNNFYFMDPSTLGNYTYIPTEEFKSRWHDIDQEGITLQNFGLQVFKEVVAYSPDYILKME